MVNTALLLMAYGSPETAADIEPFYKDIRHGHPLDQAVLADLIRRYDAVGGKTPLIDITRRQAKLVGEKLGLPVYVGMKHWSPYIRDAVEQIAADGHRRILALPMAPHYSSMSVADYKSRLESAVDEVNPGITFELIDRWGDYPLYIDSLSDRVAAARRQFNNPDFKDIEVVFTAHSLPARILASGDPYNKELEQTARLVAARLSLPHWRRVFQSAGKTQDDWLGPDILQELPRLAEAGIRQVLAAPTGFTTDNLEIIYDLDIQAGDLARSLGLAFRRIETANTTPLFLEAVASLIVSRLGPR